MLYNLRIISKIVDFRGGHTIGTKNVKIELYVHSHFRGKGRIDRE